MNENWSEELISAYLDGELSPSERAAVERRVKRHPEDARLLKELRQLHQDLENVPRYKLDAEFSQRVINAAGQIAPASRSPRRDSATCSAPVSGPISSSFRSA